MDESFVTAWGKASAGLENKLQVRYQQEESVCSRTKGKWRRGEHCHRLVHAIEFFLWGTFGNWPR